MLTPIQPQISVVIPGYKGKFLPSALQSLSQQTDKNFEVVVGDDFSPDALGEICYAFADRLTLRYHRFESNLGSNNLVAHWRRSIELAHGEWIWLMGDDDELEPNSIAAVGQAIRSNDQTVRLWHVDTVQIDEMSRVIRESLPFPESLTPLEFVRGRMCSAFSSYACEYIFRKDHLNRVGGFLDFPLAWCSDDATWLRLSQGTDIKTVRCPAGRARWRLSSHSISGGGSALHLPKLEARLLYLEWLCSEEGGRCLGRRPSDDRLLGNQCLNWLLSSLHSTRTIVPSSQWWNTLHRVAVVTNKSSWEVAWKMARMQRWTRAAANRQVES